MKKKNIVGFILETGAIFLCGVFVFPLIFVIINSFKTYKEMMTSFLSFPSTLYLDNYITAWRVMNGGKAFLNSISISIISVAGIIFFASMAAYKLARTKSKKSWYIYVYFIFAMIVPFHSIMIPLVKLATFLHLTKTLFGMVLIYWGMGMPFAIFLIHGFVKSIPYDIEEASIIDGCSPFKTYFYIVFPLLRPVISTLAVLDILWIWNDFLLPMLIIFMNKNLRTVPLTQFNLYGEYNSQWNVAIAALVIAITPCILFFLLMQKFIVGGITAGSVKG